MNSAMIAKYILDWRTRHSDMYKKYLMFTGKDAEIFNREFKDKNKINHQLFNDFLGNIVGIKKGYFIGQPVTYSIDPRVPEDSRNIMTAALTLFNRFNDIEVMDMATAEMCGVAGVAYRQICNVGGDLELYNIDPWQIIPITSGLKKRLTAIIRYYIVTKFVEIKGKLTAVDVIAVEYYDDQLVTYYIQSINADGKVTDNYILNPDHGQVSNPLPHFQNGVPFIKFKNNEQESGDGDKVYSLINAYNSALSDLSSEVAQFRLAYLLLYGMTADSEEIERMKKTGAFSIDKDGKAEFITKKLNDEAVENLLNRLEKNITKYSGSIDLNSSDFYSDLTRIAIHFRLLPLETKTMELQHYFTAALRSQYRIIQDFISVSGRAFDYLMLIFTYHRSTPNHIKEDAEASVLLMQAGYSQHTIFEKGNVVEDPEKEMERVEKENKKRIESVT